MRDGIEAIREVIAKNQRFILAGHFDPDGDAIGACMGLALALAKLGKESNILLDAYPDKYRVIPGAHFLWKKEIDSLNTPVFIALDCGDITRLGRTRALFERTPLTLCIDHHETNTGFAQYNWIEAEASSTCEMIYDLIAPWGVMDTDIAAALYAGIVTDTGGFRFNRTTGQTLEKVARLVETGIHYTDIYNELLHNHEFVYVKALGVVYSNARQAMGGRIVYATITQRELAEIGATTDDIDGVARFLMSTRGASAAFFAWEGHTSGEVYVSLRSRGLHMGRFAKRWGGGGHRLAAGCTVTAPIERLVPEIIDALEKELATTCVI